MSLRVGGLPVQPLSRQTRYPLCSAPDLSAPVIDFSSMRFPYWSGAWFRRDCNAVPPNAYAAPEIRRYGEFRDPLWTHMPFALAE